MPAIPVAAEQLTIFAMSGARPAPARAELSDGTSRVIPGEQATHKQSGLPLWQCDAVIPGDATDEKSRALNLTVKVASATKPDVQPGVPVRFENLAVIAYVDGNGRAALSWSASGVQLVAPARGERAA